MITPRFESRTYKLDSPSGSNVTDALWRAPKGCTIVGIYGYRVGGTGAVVNAQIGATKAATDLSLTSADAYMAATLDSAHVKMAAGDVLSSLIVSVAGTPTSVRIQVDVAYDSDAR